MASSNGEADLTPLDSDAEHAESDDEFSRVLQTPRSAARPAGTSENTPLVNSTPLAKQNAPWHRETQETQQTQQLPPLTGTQLQQMMSLYSDGDDGDNDDNDAADDEPERDEPQPSDPEHRSPEADAEEDPIVTDEPGPDLEEERIMSSEDEADVTPVNGDSQATNGSARGAGHTGLEYIDETPMKLLSMPTPTSPYTFVAVKWHKDPHWWPARADREDWEARNRNANVLFRLDESGKVSLSGAVELWLKPGDTVHLNGKRSPEYTILKLWASNNPSSVLTTNDGFDKVRLQPQPKSTKSNRPSSSPHMKTVVCDVGDLSFTSKDVDQMRSSTRTVKWKGSHAARGARFGVDPSPLKRRRLEGSPGRLPDAIQSAHAIKDARGMDPARSHTVASETRRVPAQNAASTLLADQDALEPIAEVEEDQRLVTPQRSPTKARLRSAKKSPTKSPAVRSPVRVARSTQNPLLFANAVFTVSISEFNPAKTRLASRLTELAEKHGAEVLQEGISQKVRLSQLDSLDGSMPDLEHDFGDATFAAVLADTPRRTLKYLEMLALGWPCLQYRYLEDCIDQNEILDWRPYVLPAGELNLSRRSMIVNSNVSAFHSRWLRGLSLNEQFVQRKITLRCTVPLCIIGKRASVGEPKMILAALCAPRYRAWFYTSIKTVPSGSLVVEIEGTSDTERPVIETDAETLHHIQNYAALDHTVCKSSDWFAQCIISGTIV